MKGITELSKAKPVLYPALGYISKKDMVIRFNCVQFEKDLSLQDNAEGMKQEKLLGHKTAVIEYDVKKTLKTFVVLNQSQNA